MYKQKREHSRRMDALIIGCAIGSGCDEAELVHLAIEYAHAFRCPYQLSSAHMRSLETREEQEAAKQMEANVNTVIAKTIQRERPMSAMGRLAMERLSMQPSSNLRPIMHSCKCTGPRQSSNCKMPLALCKVATHALSRTIPRMEAASPKTRKSKGGNHKSKSLKIKRRS